MLSSEVSTATDCPPPPQWSAGLRRNEFRLGSALLIALFLSAGCGRGPEVGKVHGTVTLDGKPLPKAVVTFVPVGGGRQSSGFTDADGHYQLSFLGERMGARLGKHKVSIHTSGTEETGRTHEKERVPVRYNTETTLEREVAGGGNEFNFDLSSI